MEELILEESGPALSPSDIKEFEDKIGAALPSDFKSFLLQSNGGYPRTELLTPPFAELDPNTGNSREQATDVDRFLSLSEIRFEYDDYLDEGYIPSSFVPFAYTSFGNLLLVRVGDEDDGGVYFSNHDLFDKKSGQFAISKICGSFSEFIEFHPSKDTMEEQKSLS